MTGRIFIKNILIVKIMLKKIDQWLNGVIMYRLVLWGLSAIAVCAIAWGFLGLIAYDGSSLLLSALIAVAVCQFSNLALARICKAQINAESSMITGLILFLIMGPVMSYQDAGLLAVTALVATLSKYLLAYSHKHIFNPVAVAAVIMATVSGYAAWWWIATWNLLPIVLVVSFLIVRKTRREALFVTTVLAGLATSLLYALTHGYDLVEALEIYTLAGPMLFFAAVMVTEPLCLPGRRNAQLVYGVLVGVLANWKFNLGLLYSSPELALVIANLWSFVIGYKHKLYLTLEERRLVAANTYEFVFAMNQKLRWLAGQYLEITLPHSQVDQRGVRRSFTIASSDQEGKVKLGVKFPNEPSSFKKKLLALAIGERVTAGKPEGDFILPRDKTVPILCLAGGIGVTPFRAMISELIARGERRDLILLYANRSSADVAYRELFREAVEKLGIKVYYLLTHPCEGEECDGQMIDRETITRLVPQLADSIAYISGPSAMVTSLKKMLKEMGVSAFRIKTDYFSGF